MPSLQDAQNQVNTANTNATNAQNAYNAYNTGGSYIEDALKQAFLQKFNGNQDLVNDKNNAYNQYLNAPATAHANFNNYYNTITGNNPTGVVNPYVFNDYVQGQTNNAYTKYNNYNDLMNQRLGTINDLIASGKNLYGAQTSAAQGALSSAEKQQQAAQQAYTNAYQQQYEAPLLKAQANYYNGLGGFYGSGAGQSATPAVDPYQTAWNNYQSYLINQKGIKDPASLNANDAYSALQAYLQKGPGVGLDPATYQKLQDQATQYLQEYNNQKLKSIGSSQPKGSTGNTNLLGNFIHFLGGLGPSIGNMGR